MFRFGDTQRIAGPVRATYILLVVLIMAYWISAGQNRTDVGGVVPAEWFDSQVLAELWNYRPSPFITLFWSVLLHGSWAHLAVNLLFLFWLGPNIEARIGAARFALAFFCCASAGSMVHCVFFPHSQNPIYGASGAVSGLMAIYLLWFWHHAFRLRLATSRKTLLLRSLKVKFLFAIWLMIQILCALTNSGQTAFLTHLGGFACGALLATARMPASRKFRVFTGNNAV